MKENERQDNTYILIAEYRLLAALSMNKLFTEDSRVFGDIFPHMTARSIYKAINHLHGNEVNITHESLYQTSNELDFNVSEDVIFKIFSIKEIPNTLDDILEVLLEDVKKQDFLKALNTLKIAAQNNESDELTGLLYEADKVLKRQDTGSSLKDTDQWTGEYIEELRERAKGKTYSYGDPFLDQLIKKGAYPGAITLIASATGQGKSTLVLNIINNYIEMQIPAMYVTLEMSGTDTFDRLLGIRRKIPTSALYANNSSLLDIIPVVEEEREELRKNKRFFLVEDPHIDLAKLRQLIKEFKQRTGQDYAVIAIDLITQISDFMSTKNKMTVASSMEFAVNELNAMAKELNVHFIAVVQFNRDADNTKVLTMEDLDLLRPSLNNVKNSAALGERARVVISLFRKKYYADRYLQDIEEAELMEDIMELNILKNSSGPVGNRINYLFDGEFFTLTPYLQSDIDKKIEEQRINF